MDLKDDVLFRPMEKKDYPKAAELACGIWNFYRLFPDARTAELSRDAFFRYYLTRQNYGEVAERGGEIVGILLGYCSLFPFPPEHQAFAAEAGELAKILRTLPDGEKFCTAIKRNSACENRLFERAGKTFDAELVLFATSSKARGLGVGTKLLHRFCVFLKNSGAQNLCLYTDSFCNYGYYDHIGYRRLAETEGILGIEPDGKPSRFFLYEHVL